MPRPLQTTGTKICTTCKVEKDIQEFYLRGGKASPNSRKAKCKKCEIERVKQSHDPVKYREAHLKRKYGMTMEDYDRMLAGQNHQCAACPTTEPGGRHSSDYFVVDHCHTTGKVRGLLCHNCNTALGLLHDDLEKIKALENYLTERTA